MLRSLSACVRTDFNRRDFEAAVFQKHANAACRHALPQAADHASADENVFHWGATHKAASRFLLEHGVVLRSAAD